MNDNRTSNINVLMIVQFFDCSNFIASLEIPHVLARTLNRKCNLIIKSIFIFVIYCNFENFKFNGHFLYNINMIIILIMSGFYYQDNFVFNTHPIVLFS